MDVDWCPDSMSQFLDKSRHSTHSQQPSNFHSPCKLHLDPGLSLRCINPRECFDCVFRDSGVEHTQENVFCELFGDFDVLY